MARKFRIRMRRKNKSCRWKKGACASTNPPVNTHRSCAPSICPSIIDNETRMPSQYDNDLQSDAQSTANFTVCTNATFSHIGSSRKISEENKLINDEIITVLSSVTEVLRSDKFKFQEESDLDYLVCLITFLETECNSELTTSAILYLISLVIKKVDDKVLLTEYEYFERVFRKTLLKYEDTKKTLLLRSWIKSFSYLLSRKVTDCLQFESVLLILKFWNDSRPRVRKCCHNGIACLLVAIESKRLSDNSITNHVYNFCKSNLEEASLENDISTNALISMYRSIIAFMEDKQLSTICDYLFKIMQNRSQIIRNHCLQVLYTLFRSKQSRLSSDIACKLINALYAYQPKSIEITAFCTWVKVITTAHIRLFRISSEYGWLHLPKLMHVSLINLLSDNSEIQNTVNMSIKEQINVCVGEMINNKDINNEGLKRFIEEFVQSFQSKFSSKWNMLFARFADLIKILPVEYFECIQKYLSLLSQIRPDQLHNEEVNEITTLIDSIISNSVRVFGPERIITAIPLTYNGSLYCFEPQWLFDIFKTSIEKSSLKFFVKFFLPYAIKAYEENESNCNIWSLFPAFCKSPQDSQLFSSISRGIGMSLNKNAKLQPIILRGLLNLLKSCNDDQILLKSIQNDSKNFLPILLNIYVSSSNRQDVHNLSYNTIYEMCKIIDYQLNELYFSNIMQRLDAAQKMATRKLLLELLPCFIKKLNSDWQLKLYKLSIKLIENVELQKRGYRLLYELVNCSNSRDVIDLKYTMGILLNCETSVIAASRHSKLSCLSALLNQNEELVSSYFQPLFEECLICAFSGIRKTNMLAKDLLIKLCTYRITNDSTCSDAELFFDLCKNVDKVLSEQDQKTEAQCCCANVLTLLIKHHKHLVIGQFVNWIMNKMKQLFYSGLQMGRLYSRTCVLCATLIKILDPIVLMTFLELIVKSLFTNYNGNTSRSKSKLKIALRLLSEKVGLDMVSNCIPVSDPSITILMRNIRKSLKKNDYKDNKTKSVISNDITTLRSYDTTKFSRKTTAKHRRISSDMNTQLMEDTCQPLDLLDTESIAKFHIPNIQSNVKRESMDDDMFTVDSGGRIIIKVNDSDDEKDESTVFQEIDQKINKLSLQQDKLLNSTAVNNKRKYAHSGDRYRSKRSRGDVKGKNKLDPYAYIPLTIDMANKRKAVKSGKQFKSAIKRAKLGAQRAARHGHKRRK